MTSAGSDSKSTPLHLAVRHLSLSHSLPSPLTPSHTNFRFFALTHSHRPTTVILVSWRSYFTNTSSTLTARMRMVYTNTLPVHVCSVYTYLCTCIVRNVKHCNPHTHSRRSHATGSLCLSRTQVRLFTCYTMHYIVLYRETYKHAWRTYVYKIVFVLLFILPSPSLPLYRDIVEYLLTSGASLLSHDSVTRRTPLHAAGVMSFEVM